MSGNRAYNFNPGPSALPETVLLEAQEELLNFQDTRMSVMELSHRSSQFEQVHNEAIALLTELLSIPDTHQVLFLQGGASMQFGMIPMNYLSNEHQAAYVLSGYFAQKAHEEAKKFGTTYVPASSKEQKYRRIPKFSQEDIQPQTAYVHITSNNTIFGTQWSETVDTGDVPLIADLSSDIMSRPIDVAKYSLIYAGAQKNLGPSGVTVVIIDKLMLNKAVDRPVPTMLDYRTYASNNSLYNTPPTFSIYLLGLVLKWAKQQGGVKGLEEANIKKSDLIYNVIDESRGFYVGHAEPASRSRMNLTFRLASEELEKKFSVQAKENGFVGINGHRAVGGFRVSAYNAVTYEACDNLAQFMRQFALQNG